MSDDESDASIPLFTSSPESESGVTARDSRESGRRESRRSHFVFLAILIAALAVVIVTVGVALGVGLQPQPTVNLPRDPTKRAEALLTEYPVIDGSVYFLIYLPTIISFCFASLLIGTMTWPIS